MLYHVANVYRYDEGDLMAMAQVVPTDESYERLDDSRPVVDFFLTTEGSWKASRYYDPATHDRGMIPGCFSPDERVIAALEKALVEAKKDPSRNGCIRFEMED